MPGAGAGGAGGAGAGGPKAQHARMRRALKRFLGERLVEDPDVKARYSAKTHVKGTFDREYTRKQHALSLRRGSRRRPAPDEKFVGESSRTRSPPHTHTHASPKSQTTHPAHESVINGRNRPKKPPSPPPTKLSQHHQHHQGDHQQGWARAGEPPEARDDTPAPRAHGGQQQREQLEQRGHRRGGPTKPERGEAAEHRRPPGGRGKSVAEEAGRRGHLDTHYSPHSSSERPIVRR